MRRKTRSSLLATSGRPSDSLTALKGAANLRHHTVVSLHPLTFSYIFLYDIGHVALLARHGSSVQEADGALLGGEELFMQFHPRYPGWESLSHITGSR